jgi:GNAT superfamily N-acetyltransferase
MRVATTDDIDAITATISTAFHHDPVWSWAFPDDARRQAQYMEFWRPFVAGAVVHLWVFVTDRCEAAALWIPPGEPEFLPEDEPEMVPLAERLLGPAGGARIEHLFERFDEAHPPAPSYYLTLLATHTDHRGHGIGMRLLAESLECVDATGMPAYLESTNPSNDARYARVGFEPYGRIDLDGGPSCTTMWRRGVPSPTADPAR